MLVSVAGMKHGLYRPWLPVASGSFAADTLIQPPAKKGKGFPDGARCGWLLATTVTCALRAVILIEDADLRKAVQLVVGCEHCSEDAEIPFDNVLDRVAGSDPSVTDYVMARAAKRPRCFRAVTEKTLVEYCE